MEAPRVPTRRYEDPLDAIWLACARQLGLRVARSREVYASTDGRGMLLVGTPETLDPDDCVAQMIFHELCHALVQGEDAFSLPDWGLDNTSRRDVAREHATLRLQAFLSGRHGLRRVLAPTTDYREFWDALGADPLAPRHDPSVTLAVLAARRAEQSPWAPHLDDALRATATVATQAARALAAAEAAPTEADVAATPALPSLWRDVDPPMERHPVGHPLAQSSGTTCGDCAWRAQSGRARPVSRCLQADGARVRADWAACERWEPVLDCLACGACCRSAYDIVMASLRDPVIGLHPELLVLHEDHARMRRSGDRCVALAGGPAGDTIEGFEPYTSRIYPDRPRTCREFRQQGLHCLLARRRVGLTL